VYLLNVSELFSAPCQCRQIHASCLTFYKGTKKSSYLMNLRLCWDTCYTIKMKQTCHLLELHRPIQSGTLSHPAADGTLRLCFWSCLANHLTLEPADADFLCEDCNPIDSIAPGFYLFTQQRLPAGCGAPNNKAMETVCKDLSKAVWLEGLWRGTVMKDNRLLARTLCEDGKTVIQVLRAVEEPKI